MDEPWSLDDANEEELHYHLVVQLDQWNGLVHVRGSTTPAAAAVAEEVVSHLSSLLRGPTCFWGIVFLLFFLPFCSDTFHILFGLLLAGGALEKYARFGDGGMFYGELFHHLTAQCTDIPRIVSCFL